MCTRTVGTIAHVLEAEGLATVALSLVRGQAVRVRAPRMLHCNFPLGRPLGRPGDPVFQRRVLMAAFDLLKRGAGPILEDFEERIEEETEEPLACPLPVRMESGQPEAVEEALGLRPAYERQRIRAGRTVVGRAISVEDVPKAIAAFIRIADGVPWTQAELPVRIVELTTIPAIAMDVRAFYEEAALGLSDHVPAARAAETWLYDVTATGRILRRAQTSLERAGLPPYVWRPLVPVVQQR